MLREVLRFGAVGTLGFVVDGTILTLLLKIGQPVVVSRCASFAAAVTVTWLLNRV